MVARKDPLTFTGSTLGLAVASGVGVMHPVTQSGPTPRTRGPYKRTGSELVVLGPLVSPGTPTD